MKCSNCKFYFDQSEQCRRNVPRLDTQTDQYNSDLLRDVALSLRKLAGIADEESEWDAPNRSSVEWDDARWPYTAEDDWCGEFQSK